MHFSRMTQRPLALVTGASSGLGAVFARKLAGRGFDLMLVARDAERLAVLAGELQKIGATASVVAADLTSDDGVAAVEVALIAAGRLDLLVNNAGFGTTGALATTPLDRQEQMLRLHVLAVNRLSRAALQLMTPVKRGGIITVSSVASFVNSSGNVNYCATKAWQRSFSEGLALECAPHGIRIQALCPGFTKTEFHERMKFDQEKRAPAWMWLVAEDVVETSLRQHEAGGATICIPGLQYKIAVFLARHVPLWIKDRLAQRVYTRE